MKPDNELVAERLDFRIVGSPDIKPEPLTGYDFGLVVAPMELPKIGDKVTYNGASMVIAGIKERIDGVVEVELTKPQQSN